MHPAETAALAVLVPLTVVVAVAGSIDGLAGWLLAVPLGFLLLNVVPFFLACRTPRTQWLGWLALLVVWAWFQRDGGGVTGFVAWMWLVIAAVEMVAAVSLVVLKPLAGGRGKAWRVALLAAPHLVVLAAGFFWGWWWAAAGGALIASLYCAMVLRPGSQALGPVATRCGEGIVVTIDDGPHPRDTPALLDELDRHDVRAVFFLIGENAARHPELVREIVRRGHVIGNHTQSHPQASFWCRGPWRTRREIAECQWMLAEISGERPRWFRAPVGHRNFFTHPAAMELGLEVMAWTRRGYDAVETDAGKVLARIVPKLREGDIVLLHEGTPHAVEVLRGVLGAAREKGLAVRLPG